MSIALLNIEKGYATFSRSNYTTRKHAHYAIEIVYCTEGDFTITTSEGSYPHLKNVIIPPNLQHSFSCVNATCQLLFLDPLSDIGRYFMQQFQLTSPAHISMNLPELEPFHPTGATDLAQVLENAATGATTGIDSRILQCVDTINAFFADQKLSVAQLSGSSFLSAGRLSHLFKAQLGISVHQYILWKKISLAVLKAEQGYSLTECAHHVGFTDSSHFNKVFYRMFGLKPFFVLKS
ncbi:helix-turn-helix domain-containing protein [Chitinophaga arvensicola]|uniref:AraC-type DNA-binding protein n=1 Tax=Chitinophaga arvensicola TaxID=29529 RepID=A0A1I0S9J1_9BACT|nr:AraC family transcriptional regulator [Chitinophaga arvensicola]SEW52758.1 AraC-type DNA-binding protein [Chitinophaga arvensicola]